MSSQRFTSVGPADALTVRSPSALVYVAVFLLVASLVAGLASFTLYQERARYRERAVVATQNIANLLEQHTGDVFEQVDLQVQSAEWYVEEMLSRGPIDAKRLNGYLAHQSSLSSGLRGFRVADAKGVVRYGIREGETSPGFSVAEEAFFKAAVAASQARSIVMGPTYAPIAKKWVIVFARNFHNPDGSLGGVVFAKFATDSFEQVFSSVQLGAQGAATIRGTDMALVHRVPTTRNAVGSRNVSKELSDIITQSPEGGVYVAATALDGIERINAYRRLSKYPFYVIVGQATSDYLRGWISSLVLVSGISAFALMAAGVAAWYAWRSQRRLLADLHEKIRITSELERSDAQRALLNAELEVKVRQAQAATAARDAFLSHVSHEMRTPVHQISGLASLVTRQPLSEKQQAWMKSLQLAAARMTAMIDQVLAFVKLESEQVMFSNTPFTVSNLMDQARQRWTSRMQAKGLQFAVESESMAHAVLGDAGQLSGALDSLLQNALEHTVQGHVQAGCSLQAREPGFFTLRFYVRDTGSGMSADLGGRLFDVFEQADSSSTTAQGGMGISLAIVRKMARLMGGDAGATSVEGEGSEVWFTVRLPEATA